MNCYHPILLPNPRYLQLNTNLSRCYSSDCWSEKKLSTSYIEAEVTSPYIYAPCRRCPACLRNRSLEWRGRLVREFEYHFSLGRKTLFCTLTYDNENITGAIARYKRDVAIFFDRLRSKYRRSIPHFCVAELGEKKGRFHIHMLLFDAPESLRPNRHLKRTKTGILHGSNDILRERWSHGLVDCSWLKGVAGAVYVSKYVSEFNPARNGVPFFSPIIVSNGLGFKDFDSFEYNKMISAIDSGNLPYYKAGGREYSYPYVILRKYLHKVDLMEISRISALNTSLLAGCFTFKGTHYRNYEEYRNVVDSFLHGVTYNKTFENFSSIMSGTDFYVPPYIEDFTPF